MTTAGRANVLLGDIQHKPWRAPSAEEYLSRLRAIFLPHIVDRVTEKVVDDGKATSDARKPYNFVEFTERILASTLDQVEEDHARQVKHMRIMSDTYVLPAQLEHKKVPGWVKNPVLLYSDCRRLTINILKEINDEMPADSDWWRDNYLSTADRVRLVVKRIKRLFHWHVVEPDDMFLPRLSFQGRPGAPTGDAEADTWVHSPHKTASLVGSIFRRHIAVGIKDEAMNFDYTLRGILPKDKCVSPGPSTPFFMSSLTNSQSHPSPFH